LQLAHASTGAFHLKLLPEHDRDYGDEFGRPLSTIELCQLILLSTQLWPDSSDGHLRQPIEILCRR
jgi:hypothetical protein